MGRDLRLLLYAGIRSSGCYASLDCIAWIRIHFGPGLNKQRWPVVLACPERSRRDASTTDSLIVNPSHLLDGITTSGSS